DLVLVHDAARPFASHALITRAIAAARASEAAVPGGAVADTLKNADTTRPRARTIQGRPPALGADPPAFGFGPPLGAPPRAKAAGRDDFSDDAALVEWAGVKVSTFEGEAGNVKLTTDDDFVRAEAAGLAALSDVRTGFGFDVHQFGDGDHVMLGGVRISHRR